MLKGILNFGSMAVEADVSEDITEEWKLVLYNNELDGVISLTLDTTSMTATFVLPDGTSLSGALS